MFMLVVSRIYEPMSTTLISLAAINSLQVNVDRMNQLEYYSEQKGEEKLTNNGYDIEFIPVKGYGVLESTFLRLYAIMFESNIYLIVYGGIKLNDKIQNSPGLQENVFRKIDQVKQFLVDENILDIDDI